jgi:hypothetical protein
MRVSCYFKGVFSFFISKSNSKSFSVAIADGSETSISFLGCYLTIKAYLLAIVKGTLLART